MSTHIGAQPDAIAPYVLMPGDPLRAQWIAEEFLDEPVLYNEVRGMYGFTGTHRGVPVSVQGSGMGQPSFAIYATELFRDYDVQAILRVGTAGGLSEAVRVRDVIIGSGASTDSSMNISRFHGLHYAPVADFDLMRIAWEVAQEKMIPAVVGGLYSSDQFYNPRAERTGMLADHGVLGVEMEAAALYTIAAEFGRRGLAICTVSDHLLTGEETSAAERQSTFSDMVDMALETVVRIEAQDPAEGRAVQPEHPAAD